MNRADSAAPRYYDGDPLARNPLPYRPPLVEYPGRTRTREDELGEVRYRPVKRTQTQKRRLSRRLLAYLICSATIILGLTIFYLVREERVASANAACTQLDREIAALRVSYEAKRTQFECSTDIAAVRNIAGEKLNMGYVTEDQIVFVDYDQPLLLSQELPAVAMNAVNAGEGEERLPRETDPAMDMILPNVTPGETPAAISYIEEGGIVIPVETPEGDAGNAGFGEDVLPPEQESPVSDEYGAESEFPQEYY